VEHERDVSLDFVTEQSAKLAAALLRAESAERAAAHATADSEGAEAARQVRARVRA
jgi:hypothetical protein